MSGGEDGTSGIVIEGQVEAGRWQKGDGGDDRADSTLHTRVSSGGNVALMLR